MTTRPRLLPWILGTLLVCGFPQGEARCADPGGEAGVPWKFRRVYAPADRLNSWPLGHTRYLPVEPAEFEHLLATAQMAGAGTRVPLAARVITAQYEARLAGDQLTGGQATLKIVHSHDAPVLLPLDPCGLAIGKAIWTDSPRQSAVLGSAADGKLGVLVERSGELRFQWSLRGHVDAAGAVHFQFQLPACPANRLILELPEKMTPLPDHGILLEGAKADEGFQRWQIELGGYHRLEVNLVSAERRQLTLLRQSVVYDCSLRGVDVSAQLSLDVYHQPLRQLTLALDPGLQLVSARYGDRPVAWTVASAGGGRATRVALQMPKPIQGTGQVLRLGALAPLTTEQPWRLPRIQPEGMSWQQGSLTLLVPSPLLVEQLLPEGCRQSATGPLPAPRSGESAQFQCFAPDATVQLVLRRRPPRVQLATGTTTELGGGQIKSQVVADFRAADGESFSLEADVASQWIIDSLELVPAEAMNDWTLEESGGKSTLKISLAKALSPTRPLRLKVAARGLYSPLGQKLAVDDLVPLRFPQTDDGRRLVAVRAAGSYELNITGGEQLNRIDPASLEARELELLAEPQRGLLFHHDSAADALRISLDAGRPGYAGTIRAEATLLDGTLQESYWLHCVPESARVDRVLVHFSHRRDAPLHWTLGPGQDQQLSAQPLSADELAAAGIPPEEEAWEIVFHRPRSAPFEIRGTRSVRFTGQQPVSLASLPEATTQRGTLVIRCLGPKDVRIRNTRLTPIPAEPVPAGQYPTARATYRYNPGRDTAVSPEPAVTVSTSEEAATPLAWVWSAQLHSRYQADGTGLHLAIYHLQRAGCGRIRLTLPPTAAWDDVRNVWVNQSQAAWDRLDGPGPNSLAIDLPSGEKFSTVSVCFTTRASRLGIVGCLEPPLPRSDAPILVQDWTVWLPPGYAAFDPDPRWQAQCAPRATCSQRLLGPFGRAAEHGGRDWLAADHWLPAVGDRAARRSAQRKADQLWQLLGALAEGSASSPEAGGLDWGKLLAHESVQQLPVTLLVDRFGLAEAGLAPHTPVQPAAGENPRQCGIALLQQANLALLLHPDAMLLTGRTSAALSHACLALREHEPSWWILPGPLADRVKEAAAAGGGQEIVPAETWAQQSGEPSAPWTLARLDANQPADTCGWTAYRLEIPATGPVRLQFVHSTTMQLLGWVTFLLLIALGWWKGMQRPALLTSLVALFGIAALLVAEPYVPIASGAVLGTLFCLAGRLIFRSEGTAQEETESSQESQPQAPSTLRRSVPAGIVLLAATTMIAGGTAARGETPESKSPQASPALYDVFIPTDQQGRPTGSKYYVPEELYNQLYRHSAAVTDQPQGWLLSAATYRGVLAWQAAPERLVVAELKAVFDLQVFGRAARLRIPFSREGSNLSPEGALLDGRVVRPECESGGSASGMEVAEPGRHRLELSLRPTLRTSGNQAGFELSIPPLANARLELVTPAGAPAIEVATAAGSISREGEPPRLIAELGPTNRLSVSWQQGARRSSTGTAVEVEELLWLKVQPGSVVVDAKFGFKVIEGRVRELVLATDPRLRLLPFRQDDPPIVHVQQVPPGQPQIIRLELPRPVSDQVVLDATFLVTGTSGVGNLRLPQLETQGARLTKRWLAVSVDPALAYEEQVPEGLEKVPVPDFIADWGSSETQPQFAYRLASGLPSWSISTRPREPQTTVEQVLALSFGQGSAEVQFDAQLETTAGYCFQHRLAAPADLEIERVSVLEENAERAARWSRGPDGLITVFLSGPAAGKQTLSLRGRLNTPLQRPMPLPLIQIQQAQVRSFVIQLFRRPSVTVKVTRAAGLVELDNSSPEQTRTELGRPVKAFAVDGKRRVRANVVLAPNHPNVHGEQITRLRCNGQSWEAEVDFRMEVKGGVLDQIRIDAPAPFNGPYQINPPEPVKIVARPGEPRLLIVEPRAAISGAYRFSISSPLVPGPGEAITAPEVRVRSFNPRKPLLLLPTQREKQPLVWETRGLKRVAVPADFVAPAEPLAAYQARRESFQATLTLPQHTGRSAEVRLADISVAWRADGSFHGVAVFDLVPGRLSECPLSLPAGCHLVNVSIAGIATTAEPSGQNTWRIPLGLGQLPQPVEILFAGTLPDQPSSAERRFGAPTLGALPVRETLWTVAGPSQFGPGEPEGIDRVAALRCELVRLRSLVALLDLGSLPAGSEPEELLRWYQLWTRRLAAIRTVIQRELAQGAPVAGERSEILASARAELQAMEQQQARVVRWLAANGAPAPPPAAPTAETDTSELWCETLEQPRSITPCLVVGGAGSVTFRYGQAGDGHFWQTLTCIAGLLTVVGLILVGMRRGTWDALCRRYPYALGVAAGVAWWLWLSPGILGCAMVLFSLLVPLVQRWRRARQGASTIIALRSDWP